MKSSSGGLDSEKDFVFKKEHDENVNKDGKVSEKIMYMPTLPSTFNSLVEKAVKIEIEEPLYIIELLGNLLGVKDYKTNKAAFWFLDIIALQVLRYKNCLNDHYRSILISWLAGEMKLIRDKKLLREDFFKEIKILFLYVAEKLSNNNQLLHWELLMDAYSDIMSRNSTTDATVNSEVGYLIMNKLSKNKLSKNKLIAEDVKYMSQKNKFSFIGRDSTNYNGNNDLQEEKLPKNFKTFSTTKNSQRDMFTDANTYVGSSSLMNPSDVLDIIAEATYDMYANELRYALIYAVFVKPIQIKIVYMPRVFRVPQIKPQTDSRESFDMQLRERLEKIASESEISNGKKFKGKKMTENMTKRQIIKDLDMEIPPTPPPSLIEEDVLANTHQFILPLIEANEAIYKMHREHVMQ